MTLSNTSVDDHSPLRKRETVSLFPTVYPALRARSSKSAIYWLISGNLNVMVSSVSMKGVVLVFAKGKGKRTEEEWESKGVS